jgi:hypothetical protein
MLATASADFSLLVRPELRHQYKDISKFLFEDPESLREQSGRFKVCWDLPGEKNIYIYFLHNKIKKKIKKKSRWKDAGITPYLGLLKLTTWRERARTKW